MLSLLVNGWTQPEIAEALHMSEVLVKRTVTALRARFGVRMTNALCWQAGRLGFVPLPHADDGEVPAKIPSVTELVMPTTGTGRISDPKRSYEAVMARPIPAKKLSRTSREN